MMFFMGNGQAARGFPPITRPNMETAQLSLRKVFRHWKFIGSALLAALIPVLLPTVHMLIFSHLFGMETVDSKNCSCSCWDSVFKGVYEKGTKANYKHVYFNCTGNAFKMWTATMFFFLGIYEGFKLFFSLLLRGQLRWTMAILALNCLYSLYYAWWSYWNFWNDEFYYLWYHQFLFTLTEAVIFLFAVLSLDKSQDIQPNHVLAIGTMSLFHIGAAFLDQFVDNVFYGYGERNEVLRDFVFLFSDLLTVILAGYELRKYSRAHGTRVRENLVLATFIFLFMLVFVIVFPSDDYGY